MATRSKSASLRSPQASMEALSEHFTTYLAEVDEVLSQDVPDDFLHSIISSLQKLHSRGLANVVYMLSEALLKSTSDADGFGIESLAFKVLQLMLVSFMDTEENQASLLKSCDQVVAWIFDGLADSDKFVDHVNSLLFPTKNLQYRYGPAGEAEEQKFLSVVRVSDQSVQCEYLNVPGMAVDNPIVEDNDENREDNENNNVDVIHDKSDGNETVQEHIVGVEVKKIADSLLKEEDALKATHLQNASENVLTEDVQTGSENAFENVQISFENAQNTPENTPDNIENFFERVEQDQVSNGESESNEVVETQTANYQSCHLCNTICESSEILEQHIDAAHVTNNFVTEQISEEADKSTKSDVGALGPTANKTRKKVKKEPKLKNETVVLNEGEKEMEVYGKNKKKVRCKECGKYVLSLSDHRVVHEKIPNYQCMVCEEKFLYRSQRKVHMEKQHPDVKKEDLKKQKEETVHCDVCNKDFASFYSMVRHKREYHKLEKSEFMVQGFTCELCGYLCGSQEVHTAHMDSKICRTCSLCTMEFDSKRDLGEHNYMAHTDKESRRCLSCSAVFDSDLKLRRHVRDAFCLACLTCSVMFAERSELEQHRANHKQKPVGKCPICYKRFYSKYFLMCHFKDVHKDQANEDKEKVAIKIMEVQEERNQEDGEAFRPNFVCTLCDKKLGSRSLLSRHKRKAHWRELGHGHLCNICGGRFRQPNELHDHMNIHTGARTFACERCPDLTFSTGSALRQHRWYHKQASKVFLCNICGQQFRSALKLREHEKREHTEGGNIKKFKCDECEKRFWKKSELNTHIKIVHVAARNFACDVCGKKFKQAGHLKDHLSTHSKKPRFYCSQCGEGFVHRLSYKRHMVKHEGLKQFECSMCKKAFDCMDYLMRHLKLSHSGVKTLLPKYRNPPSRLREEDKARPKRRRLAQNQENEVVISQSENIRAEKMEFLPDSEIVIDGIAGTKVNDNVINMLPMEHDNVIDGSVVSTVVEAATVDTQGNVLPAAAYDHGGFIVDPGNVGQTSMLVEPVVRSQLDPRIQPTDPRSLIKPRGSDAYLPGATESYVEVGDMHTNGAGDESGTFYQVELGDGQVMMVSGSSVSSDGVVYLPEFGPVQFQQSIQ